MRPNHQRRQRGRNGKPNKFPNRNQSYDSNGPDVRVRGTAHQIFEKYQALAREAATSGDRVMAEAYYQHAEHYFRIIQAQGGFVQPRYPQPWEDSEGGEEASGGGEGVPVDGGMGGAGGDLADGPQPAIDYQQQGAAGEDYQQPRDNGYNGEDRYRGRDDNRGGDGRGYEGRRQDRREPDRREPDRREQDRREPDRREDDGYGQRGRRDFVTRTEQRYQDRQERQDRYERPPVAETRPAPPPAAENNDPAPSEPAVVVDTPEVPQDAAAENAAADNRNTRDGRPFRPRHPHFRRFRGGPRGQNGVDPAQQDQPDLLGGGGSSGSGGSGGSGSGT